MNRDELRSWSIALVDLTQGYVGRFVGRDDGEVTLEDAYVLIGGYQVAPQGIGRVRIVAPIEMLTDVRKLSVRYSTLIHLSDLSDPDFAELGDQLVKGIVAAEQLRDAIRAKRSGVVLAPAGALPKGNGVPKVRLT